MSKSRPSGVGNALTAQRLAAAQITAPALEKFLHGAEQEVFAFDLRMKSAQHAHDQKRIDELKPELERARKRVAHFTQQLAAQFPDHKPATVDTRRTEREIVIADYLAALALKRDAEISANAAKVVGDDTQRQIALLDAKRSLLYLEFYESKFRRYERELNKKPPP